MMTKFSTIFVIFVLLLSCSVQAAKREASTQSMIFMGSDFVDQFEFMDSNSQDPCQYFGSIDPSKQIDALPDVKTSRGYYLVKAEALQNGFYYGKYYVSRITTEVTYLPNLGKGVLYKIDSRIRCKDYSQLPQVNSSITFQVPLLFSQTDRNLDLLRIFANIKGEQSTEIEFTGYEVNSTKSSPFELFVQNLSEDATKTAIYDLGKSYFEVRSFVYSQDPEKPQNRSETQLRLIYVLQK